LILLELNVLNRVLRIIVQLRFVAADESNADCLRFSQVLLFTSSQPLSRNYMRIKLPIPMQFAEGYRFWKDNYFILREFKHFRRIAFWLWCLRY